jgi:hypothetical protein
LFDHRQDFGLKQLQSRSSDRCSVEFRDRESVFLLGTPGLDFESGENDPQPLSFSGLVPLRVGSRASAAAAAGPA